LLLISAARHRSRAVLTLGSGIPDNDQPGCPSLTSASTATTRPVTPSSATE
jgi:hypothetical protein